METFDTALNWDILAVVYFIFPNWVLPDLCPSSIVFESEKKISDKGHLSYIVEAIQKRRVKKMT